MGLFSWKRSHSISRRFSKPFKVDSVTYFPKFSCRHFHCHPTFYNRNKRGQVSEWWKVKSNPLIILWEAFILMTFDLINAFSTLFSLASRGVNRVRGRLGALLVFMMSVGILVGYILGDVMDFSTVPLCLLMITNIFLAGVIVIHDSPMYLLRKSRFRVRKQKQDFCMKIEGKYLSYRTFASSSFGNSAPKTLWNSTEAVGATRGRWAANWNSNMITWRAW